MIVKEIIIINEEEYQKTYSDSGYYIINSKGVKYSSAIDPQNYYDREYTESDELIPVYPERVNRNVPRE